MTIGEVAPAVTSRDGDSAPTTDPAVCHQPTLYEEEENPAIGEVAPAVAFM